MLNHHGVGISIGEEIFEENVKKVDYDWRDPSEIYCDHLYQEVTKLYKPLADVVYGNKEETSIFEQPWKGKM